MFSRQLIPFPLPCDTEKNVLQKSPPSNHQQGLIPPPHIPPSSPPCQPPLSLTPSRSPRSSCDGCPVSNRQPDLHRPAGEGAVCQEPSLPPLLLLLPPRLQPAVHGCLSCCPYRKTVRVKIVDEEEYERQENFFIALGEPKWMERGISGVRSFMEKMKIEKKIRIKSPNPNSRKYNPLSPPSLPSFSPPPVDGSTFILCPPVFLLSPCFGVISKEPSLLQILLLCNA